MPIPFSDYIDITSAVAGTAQVPEIDLMARIISTNQAIPGGVVRVFNNIDAIGVFFGITSPEYLRAQPYLAFISKNVKSPANIGFTLWESSPTPSTITGDVDTTDNLATLQAITTGTLNIFVNDIESAVTGIDLSGAADEDAIAVILQTDIRAAASGNTEFDTSTVVWSTDHFIFSTAVNTDYSITANSTTTLTALGWAVGVATYEVGTDGQTAVEAISESAAISNNFGSFMYTTELNAADIALVAAWNDGQNNAYQYLVGFDVQADLIAAQLLVTGLSGVGLMLRNIVSGSQFLEMLPAAILAATDYAAVDSVQNYMYQQDGSFTANVDNKAQSLLLNAIHGNYYCVNQKNGALLEFFQQGFLQGTSSDAQDMGVYSNEQWLKASIGAAFMNAFLGLSFIPANETGRGTMIGIAQDTIDDALNNGTISVGKLLDTTQKLVIGQLTGDDLAWMQVQNAGYWLDAEIVSYIEDTLTKFRCEYTLIYSKNDVIRTVSGSNILI